MENHQTVNHFKPRRFGRNLLGAVVVATLLVTSSLGVHANEQIVPNGIERIGAGTPLTKPVDVDVAIVDTGIDPENADLNVVGGIDCTQGLPGYPAVATDKPVEQPRVVQALGKPVGTYSRPVLPLDYPDWADGYGHGTHVSGIVAAKDNGFGVVGVAPGARLWSVKVLNDMGSGTDQTVYCGLAWVLAHKDVIDVVNMSLGATTSEQVADYFSDCGIAWDDDLIDRMIETRIPDEYFKESSPVHQAICDLVDAGIPVVVAAGNENNDAAYNYPAGFDEVITISNFADFDGRPGGLAIEPDNQCTWAGGADDKLWTHWNGTPKVEYTTSSGEVVDFAAPGTCVLSTVPGGYAEFIGTSMASPHVAGLVARYKAANPEATVKEVRAWLEGCAEPQPEDFGDTDGFPEPIARWCAP